MWPVVKKRSRRRVTDWESMSARHVWSQSGVKPAGMVDSIASRTRVHALMGGICTGVGTEQE